MMQYVVLGMHKSGTTLIAKTLHQSGIPMGTFDESVSYDAGNQYEREEALIINNSILGSEGKQSLTIEPNNINRLETKAIELLVSRLDKKYHIWGFKDPRTCLTYPFWKPYLCKPKVIVIFRDPRSVAYHYCKTGIKDYFLALRRYLQYNREAYRIGVQEGGLFISYNRLMKNSDGLIRLSKFVDRKVVNLIDPRMQRSYDRYVIRFWLCNIVLFFIFFDTPFHLHKRLLKLSLSKK